DESKPTSGFDALDADGDGILSRAEFAGPAAASGIYAPSADTASTVTTTITSVTTAQYSPSSESPVSTTQSATTAASDPLKALLGGLDADDNGQVSTSEVDQFIAQLAGQMQLALSQLRDTSVNGQQT